MTQMNHINNKKEHYKHYYFDFLFKKNENYQLFIKILFIYLILY